MKKKEKREENTKKHKINHTKKHSTLYTSTKFEEVMKYPNIIPYISTHVDNFRTLIQIHFGFTSFNSVLFLISGYCTQNTLACMSFEYGFNL